MALVFVRRTRPNRAPPSHVACVLERVDNGAGGLVDPPRVLLGDAPVLLRDPLACGL